MSRNRFDRVAQPQPEALTVRLWSEEGLPRGEVIGPARSDYRTSSGERLSAEEALAIGCTLANRYALTVVVQEAGGVWPARWGDLVG